nr:substrate-binding and VWA domain-containing protein [Planobispora longispora]
MAAGAERRRRQARQRLTLIVAAVTVALAGAVVLTLEQVDGPCSGDSVLVDVAAAVDIAPTVMEVAERFNAARVEAEGRCVLVQVTEQPPATVLRTLIGGTAGVLAARPDGWISDSSAWIRLARKQGAEDMAGTETVVATSPLVFATRKSLADRFAVGRTEMNWRMVFPATTRGRIAPNENEPDVVRVPDPSLAGAGIATVAAARDVVGTGPEADQALTAFVRWAQAGAAPDYRSMVEAIDQRSFWQRPVVIVPEQSVWFHNRRPSADPLVALHPREGTINLDYPYVVTSGDPAKASGSRAFASWLRSPETQEAVRRAGFRSADGTKAPTRPDRRSRPTSPDPPHHRARPGRRGAGGVEQAGPADQHPGAGRHLPAHGRTDQGERGKTKLSVALDAARLGLQLFPDSTHMGMWEFADGKGSGDDQRERVKIGPINEPDGGQVIRRSRLEELTRTVRADRDRSSSLNDSVLAGFREVTNAYDEQMNNTLLIITSGKDDGRGISSTELLRTLRDEWDPQYPVQIVVLAFGDDVDRDTLSQVATATNGSLHVATEPGEIIDVFLSALARRLCHPTCRKAS